LSVLSLDDRDPLLLVEGGAVDWANHSGQLQRMIEEQAESASNR